VALNTEGGICESLCFMFSFPVARAYLELTRHISHHITLLRSAMDTETLREESLDDFDVARDSISRRPQSLIVDIFYTDVISLLAYRC
jgi:hypothetical protein